MIDCNCCNEVHKEREYFADLFGIFIAKDAKEGL
jgi:hypothetical protein